ncbi:MAG: 30S ribosomal protein S20 [Candidatus Sungbacteria bacterium]|nr:30S ribosomal protein S20 [Candidatus Sungbacteria bacterium]
MPITKSAKKALRQSRQRRVRNLKKKEAYKNAMKNLKKLVAAKNLGEAAKIIPQVYKALDKAVKTGVLKKNNAARKKSQVMRWLKKT